MRYSLRIRLTDKQLQALSVITADIGQAVFASVILPFAFGLDRIEVKIVVLGLVTAVFFWTVSVYLAKEKK